VVIVTRLEVGNPWQLASEFELKANAGAGFTVIKTAVLALSHPVVGLTTDT
jgi:hypothetical protein